MKNLSITQKLIGSFGGVFVFIACFGLFILYSFNSLSSEKSNVDDWVGSAVNVSEISKNLSDLQRVINIRVMNVGKPEAARYKSEQEKFIQSIEEHFAIYKKVLENSIYDDEAERQRDFEMLNNELQLWQNYKNQISRLENSVSANDIGGSVAIVSGDMEKAFEAFYSAMEIDIKDCREGLTEAVKVSEKTFDDFEHLIHVIGIIIAAILLFVVGVLYILAGDIRRSVNQISSVTKKAAQGDLSSNIISESNDEFGKISEQVNSVFQHMRKVLGKVQNAAQEVSGSVEKNKNSVEKSEELVQEVALSVTSAFDNVTMQKEAIKDTDEHVHQIEESVEQSITVMKFGLESIRQTAEHAAAGNEVSSNTVSHMDEIANAVEKSAKIVQELGENSKEIGSIVEVISGIAEQTNLLALNAAIEAARAGEQGRGFAVVADEVRKLAEGSKESVEKIGEIVGKIQATTEQAVITMEQSYKLVDEGRKNVEKTGHSFDGIVNMVQQIEESSQQVMEIVESLHQPIVDIVRRTEKLSGMSVELAEKMESISIATADQAANIVSIAENSENLTDLSEKLETTVHEFKL